MIYLVDTPHYFNFLISCIPDRLANKPEFIRYFNLESPYEDN